MDRSRSYQNQVTSRILFPWTHSILKKKKLGKHHGVEGLYASIQCCIYEL